jgi:hypothetical protein
MIVRATKDLPVDTELVTWYQIPRANHSELQAKLADWGFNCECEMCQDYRDTEESVLSRRLSLRDDCSKCADMAEMESLLQAIDDTYSRPGFEIPRLAVYDTSLVLARSYMNKMDAYKTIQWALKVLSSLGFVIEGGNVPRIGDPPKLMVVHQWGLMLGVCIESWLMLAIAYFHVAPDLESQAWDCARLAYKICTGQDETFEETYGSWRMARVSAALDAVLPSAVG